MNAFVEAWQWQIPHLLLINIIISIVIIFFQRRDPKSVWLWLMALYFIPIFGIFVYLLLGQDYHKSKMFRIKGTEDRIIYPVKKQESYLHDRAKKEADEYSRDFKDLMIYNLESDMSVLTFNNEVDIFDDGKKKFADLMDEIKTARYFIHIQYYIIKNDYLFDAIVGLLKKKVEEGVEVRILYDGMGGRFMPQKRWDRLRKANIKVAEFFPALLGKVHFRINYRNHRKIVVIDGRVGYVGGFNIGKEYVDGSKRFGHWRDVHIKIKGDAVKSLERRFALDWNYAANENLFANSKYGTHIDDITDVPRDNINPSIGIQIITSGPDTPTKVIRDNYIEIFNKARDHIYIMTPYFIPDESTMTALTIAARSGIDVRLMIPSKPDHLFVYWATLSWAGTLLEMGARVYIYDKGFLHAKCVMADGRIVCLGTANMDIRSFELNFEVNATIYDRDVTKRLEDGFEKDVKTSCIELTIDRYNKRSLWQRFKEQVCRLVSPLL